MNLYNAFVFFLDDKIPQTNLKMQELSLVFHCNCFYALIKSQKIM